MRYFTTVAAAFAAYAAAHTSALAEYSRDVEYWCTPFENNAENRQDMYWRVNDASKRFAAGEVDAFKKLIEDLEEAQKMCDDARG